MPVNDGDRRAAEGFWSVHGPTRMGAVPALAELLAAHREQADAIRLRRSWRGCGSLGTTRLAESRIARVALLRSIWNPAHGVKEKRDDLGQLLREVPKRTDGCGRSMPSLRSISRYAPGTCSLASAVIETIKRHSAW